MSIVSRLRQGTKLKLAFGKTYSSLPQTKYFFGQYFPYFFRLERCIGFQYLIHQVSINRTVWDINNLSFNYLVYSLTLSQQFPCCYIACTLSFHGYCCKVCIPLRLNLFLHGLVTLIMFRSLCLSNVSGETDGYKHFDGHNFMHRITEYKNKDVFTMLKLETSSFTLLYCFQTKNVTSATTGCAPPFLKRV